MKHAIATLQNELKRIEHNYIASKEQGKPRGWRDSEYAMHMGALKMKRLELIEAIQILSKVGQLETKIGKD